MGAQAVRAFMSIGEVLALLQGEFPDITISKIRFLEGEGLIEPQRSPSGYRKFTHHDVERLRYILTAQRDHYLPLRVIKDQLDERVARPRDLAAAAPPVRLSREELIEAAGIDEDTLAEMESVGRVAPVARVYDRPEVEAAGIDEDTRAEMESFGLVAPVARFYDRDALEVARSVGALAKFGLHPRHLRAVRAAVEREAGLVEQAVAPLMRRRAPGAAAQA